MQTITVLDYNKAEWSRFAQAAYKIGRNDVGHRFSTLASMPHDAEMPIKRFDLHQNIYRDWLCFNKYPETLP